MTTFAAFRRQTDLQLQDRIPLADILDNYDATPAQIAWLMAGGQLAVIPRRGRVWLAKSDVERNFQPRKAVQG